MSGLLKSFGKCMHCLRDFSRNFITKSIPRLFGMYNTIYDACNENRKRSLTSVDNWAEKESEKESFMTTSIDPK